MSANLLDAGDIQRLDREKHLTEQAPRQLPAEDRSPIEEPFEQEDGFELMLSFVLEALKRRS